MGKGAGAMNHQESSEEIKEDIQETRRDMGRKIDAIQEQLNPDNLKAKARDVVNEFATATAESISEYVRTNARDLAYSVTDVVKHNPVPAALIGLGLGWILVESLSSDKRSSAPYRSTQGQSVPIYPYRGGYGRSGEYDSTNRFTSGNADEQSYAERVSESVKNAADTVQTKAQQWVDQTRDRVSDATSHAQWEAQRWGGQGRQTAVDAQNRFSDWQQQGRHYAEQAGDRAQEVASQAASYVGQAAGDARTYIQETAEQVGSYAQGVGEQAQHYAQEAGRQARDYAHAAGGQVQRSIEENPLVFGAVTLAVGTAIGLMLPQTRRENEWIGPVRDQIADTTRAAASDVVRHAQEAVEEVRPELERTVQKVANVLQETGQNVVEELKQAGKTALEDTQETTEHAKEVAKQKIKEAQGDLKQRLEGGQES
jgi:ElaB/YqjD/DUF883 family membrane-anchored ribosome-binding protein